ncbi:cytochrome c [Thioclava sp. GXIMD2076]|uniref:c-type cytochrome n=1 Tax=unclassified Thioclava TaxID=2621713 RepID=UPI0030CA5CF8
MHHYIKAPVAILTVIGSVAIANADAADPTVKAWQDGMHELRQSSNILGDMAKKKSDFNADIAGSAAQAMQEEAKKLPELFKTKAEDPESDAKSGIWDNWEEFTSHAKDLEMAAADMDTSSLAGVQAGMKAVGGACAACHKEFKD